MVKAIGCFIFGGSQTLGWLKAGYEVDRVLEMTDTMIENNSYHFVKNHPEIPIILPKEWDNDEYLESIKGVDVLFGNPPCSGLSSINRNANCSCEGVNSNLFKYVEIVNKVEPKVFLIENAPTLVKLGLPILKQLQEIVSDKYRLTVITDCAGNHSVPMQRRRTLVVGWNRDYFNGIPQIDQVKDPFFSVEDALRDIPKDAPNMCFDKDTHMLELMRFYNKVKPSQSILKVLADDYDNIKDQLTEKELHEVDIFRNRYLTKNSVWDKSAWRLPLDGHAPSMASVVQFMHPTENRDLYIREYARLMGYPDDFVFYPEECKLTTIQCCAQGVPVNFIYYIATQIKDALKGYNYEDVSNDVVYINQSSGVQKITRFTSSEFQNCLEIDKNDKTLQEVSLF